jgi:hypothetical protein
MSVEPAAFSLSPLTAVPRWQEASWQCYYQACCARCQSQQLDVRITCQTNNVAHIHNHGCLLGTNMPIMLILQLG